MAPSKSPVVYLVGAGPGDPELLTRRGERLLRQATIVFYDALVDERLLELLPPTVERCFVGKRARRAATTQQRIVSLMIDAARAGHRVVRLKCGDPCVLGRGGEEAEALRAAGIDCQIVPGVSAAIAAAEQFGIPVTHRGLSSGVLTISGHAAAVYEPVLRALPPRSVTVVVLMGQRNCRAICQTLIGSGWPSDTPFARCAGAYTERARIWQTTLGQAALVDGPPLDDQPVTLVVGDVVGLRREHVESLLELDQAAIAAPDASLWDERRWEVL
ncbi:MAG: uroporphyrinogen-III C-methyltransferase [Deltaproteobacteria bacterium]|nr:uroporphyrinogen-III C-methyltransferase [Deltaproteobacteria bacterium]